MDNQAYDHDMSVMNNNSARKKELEVGNFDNKASFMTINIRPVHKNIFLEFLKKPGSFVLHFDK